MDQLSRDFIESQIETRHWRWIGKATAKAIDEGLGAVERLEKSAEGIRLKILRDEIQELLDQPPYGLPSKEVLDTPVDQLGLSMRARNCLARAEITTVGELCSKTELDLLSVRDLGELTFREICTALMKKGLRLSVEKPRPPPFG